MHLSIDKINEWAEGIFLNSEIFPQDLTDIVYDTRKINLAKGHLFIALVGAQLNGHDFIALAYKKGIRNFLVQEDIDIINFQNANFIKVDSTLIALQTIATNYRKKLTFPIIGITGSNGKTIVKEWLAQALSIKYKVGKSPMSYNSKLGVPLSILQLREEDDIGLIEAGISELGEMQILENIIKPKIGILTSIGDAHSQGFNSIQEKLSEKLQLFKSSELVFYNSDNKIINEIISLPNNPHNHWGVNKLAKIKIISEQKIKNNTELKLIYNDIDYTVLLPLTGEHNVCNAMHVISYLLYDNWSELEIQKAVNTFKNLPNRLEIKTAINNSLVINDSYSADLVSLQAALSNLKSHHQYEHKVIFLSDFDQQHSKDLVYSQLHKLLADYNFSHIIFIGINKTITLPQSIKTDYYKSTEDCLTNFEFNSINNAAILIKGSRKFKLEKLVDKFSVQVHQTNLEINLSAIRHNLAIYKSYLNQDTKIMAVVKAEAYGSGSQQLASFLSQESIDYLAVALIDEAINLRRKGCNIPIMIFNIQESNLDLLWKYDLEPEVYSMELLQHICNTAKRYSTRLNIHIKIDSGMHRLGFERTEIPSLLEKIKAHENIIIKSVFSHLAASENELHDNFTLSQITEYANCYKDIAQKLSYRPMKHIVNTAGIIRFPKYQFDMVRLGLGLYGLDTTNEISSELQNAHTLTAKVLQIKNLKAGETTGYNRSGLAQKDSKIAVISIGYADGLLRNSGNGKIQVAINNKLFLTIGNICMDVSMIDITNSENIHVGDEVTIFGAYPTIKTLADSCQTITYEIISRIAPRVKRTYIYQ